MWTINYIFIYFVKSNVDVCITTVVTYLNTYLIIINVIVVINVLATCSKSNI